MPDSSTRIEAPILGMHCVNCAAAAERALCGVPGVTAATVSLASDTASVEFDPDRVSPDALAAAVGNAGFRLIVADGTASSDDVEARERRAEVRREVRALAVGAAFTLPLVAASMARDFDFLGPWSHSPGFDWVLLALALPVQTYTAATYYAGAWRSLRNGAANMDVLVALGSSVAFLYSLIALLVPGSGSHAYFESSAMIVTLVRTGKFLEARARSRASRAIRALMDLAPATARLETGDSERVVPAAALKPGDIVRVRAGDRIPADGVVESGRSAVDQSALTGESLPVDRGPGDPVLGGTLNGEGLLRVRATAVGAATALGQVVSRVRESLASRAPSQRLADRVSAVFVPGIVGIGLAVLASWWILAGDLDAALVRMTAVLVVSCPCALGLATPVALQVGTGRAAAAGILFRDAATLERVHRLTTLFLDKTGTLTLGKPVLTDIVLLGPDGERVLSLAASAEAASSHPAATAVVEGARARGVRFLEARDVVSHPGLGLEAVVDGSRVRVGRLDWIDPDPASEGHRIAFGLGGRTILAVSVDGRPSGVLAVSDRLRPEARDAIDELHGMGLRTALLTGDGEVVARAVASEAGIPRFEASLMPVDKASRLASAAAAEEVVGMVGDGVNDAPALASAAVGFAIGTGSDVAKEAADVTIVGSDLRGVARAIRLSRSVVKGIRQNLFWAFAYNLALVPIAAGVLHLVPGAPGFLKDLHPALAAAAMALSSLTVVGNSLRLARTRV